MLQTSVLAGAFFKKIKLLVLTNERDAFIFKKWYLYLRSGLKMESKTYREKLRQVRMRR